jgi:purine-cytosine permease-like protein
MSDIVATKIPTWLMVTIFLVILAILAVFGDLFIFILGTILEILVFASGYNASKEHH